MLERNLSEELFLHLLILVAMHPWRSYQDLLLLLNNGSDNNSSSNISSNSRRRLPTELSHLSN